MASNNDNEKWKLQWKSRKSTLEESYSHNPKTLVYNNYMKEKNKNKSTMKPLAINILWNDRSKINVRWNYRENEKQTSGLFSYVSPPPNGGESM